MTPDEMKAWVAKATYQELFDKWVSEPLGSPFLKGELGRLYLKAMSDREPKRAPSAELVKTRKNK